MSYNMKNSSLKFKEKFSRNKKSKNEKSKEKNIFKCFCALLSHFVLKEPSHHNTFTIDREKTTPKIKNDKVSSTT